MALLSEPHAPQALNERLHRAHAVTAELFSDVVGQISRRVPSPRPAEKTTRIERLIEAGAWIDAALALIDLELPQWRVRRIAYDEGEWYCALSRELELPDWLDQSIEAHHADLPLAILSAFLDVRRSSAPSTRTSVPAVPRSAGTLYEPACCDNFA